MNVDCCTFIVHNDPHSLLYTFIVHNDPHSFCSFDLRLLPTIPLTRWGKPRIQSQLVLIILGIEVITRTDQGPFYFLLSLNLKI